MPLPSPRSTDEYAPVPPGPRQRALHRTVDLAGDFAPHLDLTTPEYLRDGGGVVEGYPDDPTTGKLSAAFLWCSTTALFERHGSR